MMRRQLGQVLALPTMAVAPRTKVRRRASRRYFALIQTRLRADTNPVGIGPINIGKADLD